MGPPCTPNINQTILPSGSFARRLLCSRLSGVARLTRPSISEANAQGVDDRSPHSLWPMHRMFGASDRKRPSLPDIFAGLPRPKGKRYECEESGVYVSTLCKLLTSLHPIVPRRLRSVHDFCGGTSPFEKMKPSDLLARLKSSAERRGDIDNGKWVGDPRSRKTHTVTLVELTAYIWDEVAMNLDARVNELSIHKDRIQPYKKRKHSTANRAQCDENGVALTWPSTDTQFTDTAHFIISAIGDAGKNMLEPVSLDECAGQIMELVLAAFGVQLDTRTTCDHIAPLCINLIEPSQFLAHTIARTDIMHEIIGTTLSMQLRRFIHNTDLGLDQDVSYSENAFPAVISELIETRQQVAQLKYAVTAGKGDEMVVKCGGSRVATGHPRVPLRVSGKPDRISLQHMCKLLAIQDYVLKLNVAFKHAPQSLVEASAVIESMRSGRITEHQSHSVLNNFLSDSTLRRQTSYLDAALDLFVKDCVSKASSLARMIWCQINSLV